MNNKKLSKKIEQFANEKILTQNLEQIFGERFGRYSKYIIQDRALPDARDGLKPVQRRILYAMYRLGMFHNKPYKKSARIVGEVIGKYHPHGDTSVYDAMVRMSQDFTMLMPLIDMHGNNGSMDGDPAAAMRYTEARLSVYAEYILQDLNKKTVGFVPNFDDEEYEPTVLPAKFPALLANGATGISAGYATEIPPHNINEIIKGAVYRINHPKCTLEKIMEIIPGPDFPTGGIIEGTEGIKEAYETGKAKIVVKSKTEIVEGDKYNQIVITEIPYKVVKAQLVKKMSEVYVTKNIDGIIDIRDESDREGLRIVVDIKKDVNAQYIRDFFFKSTDLQVNYSFNMVAINNKRPELMGLLSLLDAYIDHQKEVITNRSNFELSSAYKRLHIVEGLIAMVSILDAVIKTIRESANKKEAKENLMSNYSFTEEQAEAIVMLQLYRLTNTDIYALRKEQEELKEKVKELEVILANESKLLEVIKKELMETEKVLAMDRKTEISGEVKELIVEVTNLIAKEEVRLLITKDGYIKKIPLKFFATEEPTKLKEDDFIINEYSSFTTDTLLMFTSKGNYVYLPVSKIPDCKHKDLGSNVSTLANITADEKIIYSVPIDDFDSDKYVMFVTKNGLIKRTQISELKATRYSNALMATKLRDDDELVNVDFCTGSKKEVVVITKEGFISRYDASEVSIYAAASYGMRACEFGTRKKDTVVGGYFVNPKDSLILLQQKGNLKKFRIDEIVKIKRSNVGKSMLPMAKTSPNYVINAVIIHNQNAKADISAHVIGDKGFVEIDYNSLKSSSPTLGKKATSQTIGKPEKIIITRNNLDLNE